MWGNEEFDSTSRRVVCGQSHQSDEQQERYELTMSNRLKGSIHSNKYIWHTITELTLLAKCLTVNSGPSPLWGEKFGCFLKWSLQR